MTLSCQFLSWLNSNYFHECVALNWTGSNITHCAKDVQIRSFFWSVFSVSLRIQSECREIPTRKNSALGHSPRSILPLHRVLPNTIKSYAVSQREVFTKNASCKIFVLSAHFRNIFIIKCQLFSPQIFPLPSHITMCFYTPWKMHHYLKPNQNKNKA